MSTVLAAPAGEVAVMEVEELTVKLLAGVVPKVTAVAPVKLVPVRATEVRRRLTPNLGSPPSRWGQKSSWPS